MDHLGLQFSGEVGRLHLPPHASPGLANLFAARLVALDSVNCAIQIFGTIIISLRHHSPRMNIRNCFLSLARAWWRVTATTALEVPIIWAISRLSRSSM